MDTILPFIAKHVKINTSYINTRYHKYKITPLPARDKYSNFIVKKKNVVINFNINTSSLFVKMKY